jgi:hypothetical protein
MLANATGVTMTTSKLVSNSEYHNVANTVCFEPTMKLKIQFAVVAMAFAGALISSGVTSAG